MLMSGHFSTPCQVSLQSSEHGSVLLWNDARSELSLRSLMAIWTPAGPLIQLTSLVDSFKYIKSIKDVFSLKDIDDYT